MRNKLYVLLLLLPLVFILAGCGKKTASTGDQNVTGNQNSVTQEESLSATPLEMLKSGKSLYCTFSFKDEAQKVEQSGEFYLDGKNGKFRSEAEMTVTAPQAMKIKAYGISDGKSFYYWDDSNTKTGYKISMDKTAQANNTNGAEEKTKELDKRMDFKCKNWTVDSSKFDLPADIKFTDFEQMLNNIKVPANTTTPTSFDACSICDQMPNDDLKSQCRATNCK